MLALGGFARSATVDRPIRDDVFYFVLPDRFFNGDTANDTGGYPGDMRNHGFDPTDKGYFHGGDLKGLTAKLDYLKEMGITAIWMGPIFKNKPVGDNSAGYHGYWTTDFTRVDPHFGTNEDLKTLVKTAHQMGIKIFFDIIINHTADVIQYRQDDEQASKGPDKQGTGAASLYRGKAEYPYTSRGGIGGPSINEGFEGDAVQTEENFARLTDSRWAYTPYVPENEKNAKVPAWLNDPIYYHNRGESTFSGESSQHGDFFGLDDLFTENPKVVKGMIEIFKYWIREFRIDGFRLDTVKHVNTEFWQQFTPAIIAYAREQGIPEFFVFGEVYDPNPEFLSLYTSEARLPAVLDFGFQGAVAGFIGSPKPTDDLKHFFEKDDYYTDADSDVYSLPTFIGNHDVGRIGFFIQGQVGGAGEEEMLRRSRLGHALMYFARGLPVIYYGDEQGFTGDGVDKDSREDMFPSRVTSYNDNNLLGTDATTAVDNFDSRHPLYQALKQFGQIYQAHPALRRGVQIHRYSSNEPGIYAFSRIDPETRQEYVLAFNNDAKAHTASFKTYATGGFSPVYPAEGKAPTEGDVLTLEVPALDFVIVKADRPVPSADAAPAVRFVSPMENGVLMKDQFISVELGEDALAEVSFEAKVGDGKFEPLGRDGNAPYRVLFKLGDYADGTPITFRATSGDYAGKTQIAEVRARVDTRLPRVTVNYQNGHGRDSAYAISSTGGMIFPQPLTDNQFKFDWPEGADGVTVVFESRHGRDLRFDEPIYLSLADTVAPQAREANGRLVAGIQLDTRPMLPDAPAAEPPLPETIHVRGSMNKWKDTDPMDYVGNNTYRRLIILPAGWIEFKFADATWQKLNVGAPVGPQGATRSSDPANLRVQVPEGKGGLYEVRFFALPKSGGHYLFYRFELMTAPLGKKIFLRGSLVGTWDAAEANAFVYQGDEVYSLETDLAGGEGQEFKIGDADWTPGTNFGGAEGATATLGQPVTLVDGGGNLKIDLQTGRYLLTLDVSDKAASKLTIVKTGDARNTADPALASSPLGPFGAEIFLRGSMNKWSATESFRYLGENRYVLETQLAAGEHEFKIGDSTWGRINVGAAAAADISLGEATTLARGENPGNLKITLPAVGRYVFELKVENPDAPIVTISAK